MEPSRSFSDPKEDFYSSIAERFDTLTNSYDEQRRVEVLFEELLPHDLSGKFLLDDGCGTGIMALQAKKRGARVVAADISHAQLGQARKKGVPLLVTNNALKLPYPDNMFDIVVSSEMIEHTTEPHRAVVEIARVLKPGGIVALTCPNRAWKWLVDGATALKVRPFEGYENFPTFSQLRQFAQEANLRVEKHFGLHPWPFQVKPLHNLSRVVDHRFGKGVWGRWMINQALLATKTG